MSDEVYSIVYDRAEAARAYHEIGAQALVLAVLARIPVSPEWRGCVVYTGDAPDCGASTVCVGIRGPGAMQVQERIVEELEAVGIPVPAIYEGGPEPKLELARAGDGVWATP